MKTAEMKVMAQGKCVELEQLVAVKESNKNPDYYKTLKEFKLWNIIAGILNVAYDEKDEMPINETLQRYFKECAQGVKHGAVIEVHEGDNVLDLLDKYKDVKDVYNKIKKACENSGLTMIGSDIVRK